MKRFASSRRTATLAVVLAVAAPLSGLTQIARAAASGPTRRVNLSSSEHQAADHAGFVARVGRRTVDVSSSGRFVVFVSESRNLVGGDTNGAADIFLRDRTQGTTTRVSTRSTGGQANDQSTHPAISDNGRWIVFESEATNLVPGITISDQVYRKNRNTGAIIVVSARDHTTATVANYGADEPTVSDEGIVAFASGATNLLDGMSPIRDRVYVRDPSTNRTRLACRPTAGYGSADGSHACDKPGISADGRSVAFTSTARLVPADTNGKGDVYVLRRSTGVVERVSVGGPDGDVQSNGHCDGEIPALDHDATVVAFACTHEGHPIVDGAPANTQVYVRNRSAGRTYLISRRAGETNYGAVYPSVSANGRFVAFVSATDLTSTPTHGIDQAYVWDRVTHSRVLVSRSTSGHQANGTCLATTITGDASDVIFESSATNLVLGDTNDLTDVFVRTDWRD